jgi:hypothetical protein
VLIAASTGARNSVAFEAVVEPHVKPNRKKKSTPKQKDVSLSSLNGKKGNQLIHVPLRHLAITKLATELSRLLNWNLDFSSYTAMYHNSMLPFHADSPAIGEKFIIIKLSEDSIPVNFDVNHIKETKYHGAQFIFVPKPWSLYIVEDHLRFAAHKVESDKSRSVLRLGYGKLSKKDWFDKTHCNTDCTCFHKENK